MTRDAPNMHVELFLLFLLALFWGSSYMMIDIAVQTIPPITLGAIRVAIAVVMLGGLVWLRGLALPRDLRTWGLLFWMSIFSSVGAWTVLAWGQQYVDSALAAVLNSTSPIWVLVFTLLFFRSENPGMRKAMGALIGLAGVTLIIGTEALAGLGREVWGQLLILSGAMMYGAAAIYGRRFQHLPNTVTAAITLFWSLVMFIPASFVFEDPLKIQPDAKTLWAVVSLGVFSTGLALMLYFRLLRTLGSLGVASQSYLRSGVGVLLGVVILGERLSLVVALGVAVSVLGVLLINWPGRKPIDAPGL